MSKRFDGNNKSYSFILGPHFQLPENSNQTDFFFHEQKLAIETFTEAINKYYGVWNEFTKCKGIQGFPGSEK